MPERSGIRVELREDRLEGTTGVLANITRLLTAATHDTGFRGIGSRFDHRNLLFFGVDLPGQTRFTRADTGATVTVSARLDRVPADPRIRLLLPRCLAGAATPCEASLFQSLRQDRVRTLLIERAGDPEVIVIHNTWKRHAREPSAEPFFSRCPRYAWRFFSAQSARLRRCWLSSANIIAPSMLKISTRGVTKSRIREYCSAHLRWRSAS